MEDLSIKELNNLEIDIFTDRSSLVSFWLLSHVDMAKVEGFSVNDLARRTRVSVGLAHRIVRQLEADGLVESRGQRTGKRFYLKAADRLLEKWMQSYEILRKVRTKRFAFRGEVKTDHFTLVPALHTAASQFYGATRPNPEVFEYYVLDWKKLDEVIVRLDLLEVDRGYEILLVKPYYLSFLQALRENRKEWKEALAVLTFLDLVHFPPRGKEHAAVLQSKFDVLRIP